MPKDEDNTDGIGTAKKVAEAAKALEVIAEAMGRAYREIAKKIRPEYRQCAHHFLRISMEVRGYTLRLNEFIAPYYYFTIPEDIAPARAELKQLATSFHKREPREWISRIKFKCGEIDTIYTSYCTVWIENDYGRHVASQKQEKAASLLKELTRADAKIIDALSENVMQPLSIFIETADKEMRKNRASIRKIRNAHEKFREKVAPVLEAAERGSNDLTVAAAEFRKLANA